jgi:nitrogen fixation protein NifQ
VAGAVAVPPAIPGLGWDGPLLYDRLLHGAADGRDAGDLHAIASVVTLGVREAQRTADSLTTRLGLKEDDLRSLLSAQFPLVELATYGRTDEQPRTLSDGEAALRQLLARFTTADTWLERQLVRIVARRAQEPNHLWQDLGLRDRDELSVLMRRHFRPLVERNAGDMKWKKFLYRMICLDDGAVLCTAPTCHECRDFWRCFGDESGESLLARNRLAIVR